MLCKYEFRNVQTFHFHKILQINTYVNKKYVSTKINVALLPLLKWNYKLEISGHVHSQYLRSLNFPALLTFQVLADIRDRVNLKSADDFRWRFCWNLKTRANLLDLIGLGAFFRSNLQSFKLNSQFWLTLVYNLETPIFLNYSL